MLSLVLSNTLHLSYAFIIHSNTFLICLEIRNYLCDFIIINSGMI